MIYDNNDIVFEYEVKYSNRKSIEIRIEANGIVKLKVPKVTSDDYIMKVLEKKEEWIEEKVAYMLSSALPQRKYISGELVYFKGDKITLKITKRKCERARISFVDDELVMIVPDDYTSEHMKEVLVFYYKKLLKQVVLERIKVYENSFSVKPLKVSVRDQKTRWGSCSSSRTLSFNYRLLMAPLHVIDYIVVHEMSHLEHMNHSKSFWKKVHEVMPTYRQAEDFLKQRGRYLNFDLEVI